MRRSVFLSVFVLSATLPVAGVALAASETCPGDCRGTSGDDTLSGSARDNRIVAESGNDRVVGCGGEDELKGGDGRDEVYGQGDDDRVKGSFGSDRVFGGDGDDLVRGGTAEQTNDGVRDFLDCAAGTQDMVYFVPGQDMVQNCEISNPPA